MVLRDLHTHTLFSDGKNSPEEMVKQAIALKMECIGFSDHSYTFFDESYCMKKGTEQKYREETAALKEKYKEQIEILCGVEQDYYSETCPSSYDYAIGSVHYIKMENEYIPVDESKEILISAAEKYFGGDIYALAEEYFKTVSKVLEKTGADIIGHFDLISKFNEKGELFDKTHPRYKNAWKSAADMLLKFGKPFEINTGAIVRGYKSEPFPSKDIINYIKSRGGKFILSSDSHKKENLCFEFSEYESLVD
ncbi:MAG: histidinol-phosphatase [Clostridia bacterium]|nr:histidinol-phosphatase [Clostridia bacterium]